MKLKTFFLKIYFKFKKVCYLYFGLRKTKKYFEKSNYPRAFLIGTPEHDNLGDHAIALAEIEFLNKHFNNYQIIEITVESFWLYYKNLLKKINKHDVIFFSGGGNMGDTYYDEKIRLAVISKISNPIIIFPQTIYFKNKENNNIKNEMIKIYNIHGEKLLICSREKESYELNKKLFYKCKNFLCPDMVFYLKNYFNFKFSKKEKIGICMRNDFEQSISNTDREKLIEMILNSSKLSKDQIEYFDTRFFDGRILENRQEYLFKILSNISKMKFCVTDRLHAVIFSLIIGTPVLAIQSETPKIRSTLSSFLNPHINNILIDDLNKIPAPSCVDFDFSSYYLNLEKEIIKLINN